MPEAVNETSSGRTSSASATDRPGVVEQEPSGPPGAVEAARVGVPLVEGSEEGLARRGVQGLGRCGIEISAAGHGLKSIRPAAGTHPRIRGAIRLVCR